MWIQRFSQLMKMKGFISPFRLAVEAIPKMRVGHDWMTVTCWRIRDSVMWKVNKAQGMLDTSATVVDTSPVHVHFSNIKARLKLIVGSG
jgi:hypothetical protein